MTILSFHEVGSHLSSIRDLRPVLPVPSRPPFPLVHGGALLTQVVWKWRGGWEARAERGPTGACASLPGPTHAPWGPVSALACKDASQLRGYLFTSPTSTSTWEVTRTMLVRKLRHRPLHAFTLTCLKIPTAGKAALWALGLGWAVSSLFAASTQSETTRDQG